jgi:hypothetical protein
MKRNDSPSSFDEIEMELLKDFKYTYEYPKEQIHMIYLLFRREFMKLNITFKLNRLNYLYMYNKEYNIKECGEYKPIYYLDLFKHHFPSEPSKRIDYLEDTFLVDKKLDFICTHVIENALLVSLKEDPNNNTDVDLLFENCKCLFINRKKVLNINSSSSSCTTTRTTTVNNKLSPNDYVIYTKIDSDFYKFCKKILTSNEYFDFRSNRSILNLQNISFYIVLFLCGKLTEFDKEILNNHIDTTTTTTATAMITTPNIDYFNIVNHHLKEITYKDTNQWIRVPYWFLIIWDASTTINTKAIYTQSSII